MAQFKETFTAESIKVCDYLSGSESSAGSNFRLINNSSVTKHNTDPSSFLYAKIEFDFSQSIYFSTHRISSCKLSIYPTARSISFNDKFYHNNSAFSSRGVPAADFFFDFPEFGLFEAGLQYNLNNDLANLALNSVNDIVFYNSGIRQSVENYVLSLGSLGTVDSDLGDLFIDLDYSASVTISGIGSGHPPQIELTWDEATPRIRPISPTRGAFINRLNPVYFSWNSFPAVTEDGTVLPATSEFLWRVSGTSVVNSIPASGNSVTVPANTFPSGSIEWGVRSTTSRGISNIVEWTTVSTGDLPPLAPTDLSPANTYVLGSEPVTFRWRHNSPNGTPQSRALLKKSRTGADGTWSTLAVVEGPDNYVTVPANTIGGGEWFWTVCTYNIDGDYGDYAQWAKIIVMQAPEPPVISSVTDTPRVTISWQGADQKAWRVQITDSAGNVYDSGDRYGQQQTYTAAYLADGQASAVVSIANEYGWSSTNVDLFITNAPPGAIIAAAEVIDGAAVITWRSSGGFDRFYVLRNGVPIAKLNEQVYVDKAAAGAVRYQILGAIGDTYAVSDEMTMEVYPKTAMIYDITADGELIPLHIRRNDVMHIDRTESASINYITYAGRAYPVPYDTGNLSASFAIAVTRDVRSSDLFASMLGHLVCVKDKTGWSRTCVLDSIKHGVDRYADISLSFTVVDDEAVIAYE